MEHFAGLDVATVETAVCVVDGSGASVLQIKVETEPRAIAAALAPFAKTLRRIGHEAGALAPWLQIELKRAGLPIQCLETRHVRAALNAQRNKTDKRDAFGLAQMMRTGWFKAVHIKSHESYRLRLLLANRRNLKRKFLDLENCIRQSLKAFGECLQKNLRRSDLRLGRRQVRAITGWGDTQTKVHLSRLVELDYVIAHRVRWGAAFEYELLYDGEGEDGQRFVMGLADVSALDAPAPQPKIYTHDAERSGEKRARSGRGRRVAVVKSDPGRGGEIAEIATTPTASEQSDENDAESQDARAADDAPSYVEAAS